MKRSFLFSVSLAILLSVNLAGSPVALAAAQTANGSAAVQLQATTQQSTAAKKLADAKAAEAKAAATKKTAVAKATAAKKTADDKSAASKKAANASAKAQADYKAANAKVAKAKTAAAKKSAQKTASAKASAAKKAATAATKAKSAADAATKAYAKAKAAADAATKAHAKASATLAALTAPAVQSAANAKAADKSLDTTTIIGMTQTQLTAKFGKPNRTEPSEYGFTWYVYNSDYSRFLMAGVRSGKVVALYTNAKGLQYGSKFRLGSSVSTVRAALGKPVTYLRSGNTVAMLPHTDEKDLFPVGKNNVTVFYDKIEGNGVTSIMILPAADETAYVTKSPAMTKELGAAYQRLSVDLTNAIRVRRGLPALKVASLNAQLALSRSVDMRDRNYFDHYTPENVSPAQQAKKIGLSYLKLGENIAYGHRDAIFAHERFMNSAGHRVNVLKDYTKIGVGVAVGGARRAIITCIFTK